MSDNPFHTPVEEQDPSRSFQDVVGDDDPRSERDQGDNSGGSGEETSTRGPSADQRADVISDGQDDDQTSDDSVAPDPPVRDRRSERDQSPNQNQSSGTPSGGPTPEERNEVTGGAKGEAFNQLQRKTSQTRLTAEDIEFSRDDQTVRASLSEAGRASVRSQRSRPNRTQRGPSAGSGDGGVPASVEQQLEADLEVQTGKDLDRGEDFTISRTDEGFSAELTDEGREAVSPDEQFGDIAVTNPLTGNRLETDLSQRSEDLDKRIDEALTPPEGTPAATTTEGQLASASLRGGAKFFNPYSAAVGAKEAAEFVIADEGVSRAIATGEGTENLGPQSTNFGGGSKQEEAEQEEFWNDVEARTTQVVATTKQSLKERPIDTIGEGVGGAAAGVATGTIAGKALSASRVPVGGSDLSGKVFKKTASGAQRAGAGAKKLISDKRGQGQIPRGRDEINFDEEGFGSPDLDEETRVEQKKQQRAIKRDRQQRAEEERTAPGGDERDDPATVSSGTFRSVTGPTNVRTASRGPTTRSRSGPTAQQTSTWRSNVGDDSPTKSGELIDEEGNVRDVETETGTESAADTATTAASQADAAVAGSLSGAMAASQALSEQAADSLGRTDTRSDAGSQSISQTDLDSLSDVEVQIDSRSDTQTDTRSDTDSRLDTDTWTDVDSQTDARVDTRVDTQADIEFRNDLDIDLRSSEDDGSRRRRRGAFSRAFTNPVTDPEELNEALDFGGDL